MRLRSIAAAGLAGLIVAALVRSPALVFASLFGAALAAVVVLSRRHVFDGVTFTRRPERGVVAWGSELDVNLSLTNAKWLPLVWLRVRDRWPLGVEPMGFGLRPSGDGGSRLLARTVSVRRYERLRRRYRVRCTRRGAWSFGPVELEAGGPVGGAGATLDLTARAGLVVLPRVLPVAGLEPGSGRPLIDVPAPRSLAHDPTSVRGSRPYRPGDELRAVNWRATARRGELHANEFDPTSLPAVRILLDVAVLEHAWQGVDPERMELLCVAAASLAAEFAARGYGVGLASNALLSRDWRAIDIEPSEGALDDVLETIARILLFPPGGFAGVLSAELADQTAVSDCVVVTAAIRPNVRGLLARLRAERATTVVFVGRPGTEEAALADFVVPGDLDWREVDALPLLD